MSLATVTETIYLPGTVVSKGTRVEMRLVADDDGADAVGYTSGGLAVAGTRTKLVNASGTYTFTSVHPNSGASSDVVDTPSGTRYAITVKFSDGSIYGPRYIAVADTASSQNVQDILSSAPASLTIPGTISPTDLTGVLAGMAVIHDDFDSGGLLDSDEWTDCAVADAVNWTPLYVYGDQVGLRDAALDTRGCAYRSTGLPDGVLARVEYNGVNDSLGAGGPVLHVDVATTEHSIGAGWADLFGCWEIAYQGSTVANVSYLDLAPGAHTDNDPVVMELRSARGRVALYVDGVRVAGPVTVPAALVGSDLHGFQVDTINVATIYPVDSVTIEPYDGIIQPCRTPTVRAAGTVVESASATTLAVAYPSTVAGDSLLAVLSCVGTAAWTASGWSTVIATSGVAAGSQFTILKRDTVATGSESGTVTFTKAGSATVASGVILTVADANLTTPISGAITANSSGTNMTGAARTIFGEKRVSVWIGMTASDITITPPAGYTTVASTASGAPNVSMVIATKDLTAFTEPFGTGESTGTVTGTASSAVTSAVFLGELFPNPDVHVDETDVVSDALAAHLADTVDAHDASAVSFSAVGTIAGTNVQTAVAEVATDAASALSSHEADTTSIHGIADTSTLVTTSTVNELTRDAIGTALVAGEAIDITVNDGADTITIDAELGTDTNAGVLELATNAETVTGTDTVRATTPAGVAAAVAVEAGTRALADAALSLLAMPRAGLAPTGALAESYPRELDQAGNLAALVSGRIYVIGMHLPSGVTYSNIGFMSGATAMVTGANQWFFVADSSRVVQKFTANDTSTAWAANTVKTLALSSAHVTTYTGLHYVGIMVDAATVPTIRGVTGNNAMATLAPIISGTADTGMTTVPGSLTFAAITGNGMRPYCYLS